MYEWLRSHRFQSFHAKGIQCVRHRNSYASVVLMVVCALQFHAFAVQEKAVIRIEANGADAEGGLVAIHFAAVVLNLRDKLVKAWVVE